MEIAPRPAVAAAALLLLAASPAPTASPSGDGETAFRRGLDADIGRDQLSDPALAFHWYGIAAAAGHPLAELNVAVMHDSGRGAPHDPTKAAEWYARSAAHGNRRAEYDLGLLYEAGDGVPRNPQAARAWFKAAASHGLLAAADRLRSTRATAGAASASAQAGPLPAAIQVVPKSGDTITPEPGGLAEFVWSAPAEGGEMRYFLQVVALDPTGPREIHAQSLETTASLVRLEAKGCDYVWRVYSVAATGRRYGVTPWRHFRIQPAAR